MTQKIQSTEQTSTLELAPEHIKLAVDLIEALEATNLPKTTILQALDIVVTDFKRP